MSAEEKKKNSEGLEQAEALKAAKELVQFAQTLLDESGQAVRTDPSGRNIHLSGQNYLKTTGGQFADAILLADYYQVDYWGDGKTSHHVHHIYAINEKSANHHQISATSETETIELSPQATGGRRILVTESTDIVPETEEITPARASELTELFEALKSSKPFRSGLTFGDT